MTTPRICLAGVEVESGAHLRPVTPKADLLTRRLLTDEGGPLQVGAIVELGETKPHPEPPETEDHLIDPDAIESVNLLSHDEYVETIERIAHHSLRAAFGTELQRQGRTYAVDVGEGNHSLGCVHTRKRPDLEVDGFGKLRLGFNDTPQPSHIPINDLRFYEADHVTVRHDVFADVHKRILHGAEVWVMFGLTRPWRRDPNEPERHWLQVNGLCLEDGPIA